MEIKVIEKEPVGREYGLDGMHAIVDHPNHGRLWIIDGFGGMDTLDGGAVRWKHGMAIKLRPDDTLEGLRDGPWNDYCALGGAVLKGYDDTRPVLEWPGYMVEKVAESAGL